MQNIYTHPQMRSAWVFTKRLVQQGSLRLARKSTRKQAKLLSAVLPEVSPSSETGYWETKRHY